MSGPEGSSRAVPGSAAEGVARRVGNPPLGAGEPGEAGGAAVSGSMSASGAAPGCAGCAGCCLGAQGAAVGRSGLIDVAAAWPPPRPDRDIITGLLRSGTAVHCAASPSRVPPRAAGTTRWGSSVVSRLAGLAGPSRHAGRCLALGDGRGPGHSAPSGASLAGRTGSGSAAVTLCALQATPPARPARPAPQDGKQRKQRNNNAAADGLRAGRHSLTLF